MAIDQGEGQKPPEVLAKFSDPTYLPRRNEVISTFLTTVRDPNLHDFCRALPSYMHEVLTVEYIDALSNYLIERRDLAEETPEPTLVLEVAAGSGRLSHFLNDALEKKAKGRFRVIATDSGKSKLTKPQFPVETLDYKEALDKYKPAIVICSWMPREDWSKDFRAAESVQEYILIGEAESGISGTPETWGENPWDYETGKYKYEPNQTPLEYKNEGFTQEYLEKISDLQISHTTELFPDTFGRNYHVRQLGSTISFRRATL